MDLLKIYVNILETNEVISENYTIRMLLFNGYCEGDYFNGTILNGGVDTQFIKADNTITTLSARYMLKGYDNKNMPCHIFIENSATIENEATYTKPKIFTDSKNLKWLEQEKLIGTIENENGKILIIIKKNENQ